MNKNIRIIPRLDIKGPNLVKGIHMEGLRVLGKPEDFAGHYYTEGADELIYIDSVASLYGRNNLLEIMERTAEKIFIPLTAGGGIRSVEDARQLLRAGADKVAINTAAIANPALISECARIFGSQCVVLSIQAKNINNCYEAFTDNGREPTGKDVYEWAVRAVGLGAGEILVTSIDRDGTGLGYDIDMIKKITSLVSIPVIACGGAGKVEHFLDVVKNGHADSVSAASVFHYNFIEKRINLEGYEDEGNIEFLKKKRGDLKFMKNRLEPMSIKELKVFLNNSDIYCRTGSTNYL